MVLAALNIDVVFTAVFRFGTLREKQAFEILMPVLIKTASVNPE